MPSPKLFAVICTAALAGVILFPSGSFAQATPVEYTVEATFPAPGPRPQDIAWDGANLWVVDDSTDVIYRLDPKDCSVLQTFPAPDGNTQGLTWHEGHLWASGADSLTIYQISPDMGNVLLSIPCHHRYGYASSGFHGTGIAWVGNQLYCCLYAGMSSQIARVDLEDQTWDLLWFSGSFPLGLTYDGQYVWYSQYKSDNYLGNVRSNYDSTVPWQYFFFNAPGSYPSGIAYDGEQYWMTDSSTRTIYRINLKNLPLEVSDTTPKSFELMQNYPNPFNPVTSISFSLPEAATATLTVQDALGRTVATLVNGPMNVGKHSVTFDGSKLASGVYFYRFESVGLTKTGKMLLLK